MCKGCKYRASIEEDRSAMRVGDMTVWLSRWRRQLLSLSVLYWAMAKRIDELCCFACMDAYKYFPIHF